MPAILSTVPCGRGRAASIRSFFSLVPFRNRASETPGTARLAGEALALQLTVHAARSRDHTDSQKLSVHACVISDRRPSSVQVSPAPPACRILWMPRSGASVWLLQYVHAFRSPCRCRRLQPSARGWWTFPLRSCSRQRPWDHPRASSQCTPRDLFHVSLLFGARRGAPGTAGLFGASADPYALAVLFRSRLTVAEGVAPRVSQSFTRSALMEICFSFGSMG